MIMSKEFRLLSKVFWACCASFSYRRVRRYDPDAPDRKIYDEERSNSLDRGKRMAALEKRAPLPEHAQG